MLKRIIQRANGPFFLNGFPRVGVDILEPHKALALTLALTLTLTLTLALALALALARTLTLTLI